jgi:putative CocE/NonD family hydrolase
MQDPPWTLITALWLKGTTMRRWSLLGLMLALCAWVCGTLAEPAAAANAPSKFTAMVPMRDGIRLATDIRLPAGDRPWPVALLRTPYGKEDALAGSPWPAAQFAQNGIVVVVQDVRGRFASEGKALLYFDDGWGGRQDGLDTVAWIRQQPWCNGKIATFGHSTPATYQVLLAGAGPAGMVGQVVNVASKSVYHDETFRNGVWLKGNERYLTNFGWPPETLQLIKQHPRYDALWATMDLGDRPEQVQWPVVLIGGWFDGFFQGTLDAYVLLQDHGGADAAGHPHLVIGPWILSGAITSELPGFDRLAGELRFPKNAIYPPEAPTEMQWLRFWLTGQPIAPANEPAVRYYVMGDVTDPQAPGNVWRTADRWPPPSQPLRLYFTADGGLDPQSPVMEAARTYDYDPLRPVPTLGDGDSPVDQRRVENWPDVLLFTTPPLTQPLEVTGGITVHLVASTSARDTDFTAKLTDVYPDGRSMLVTDGIVRASYRNSVQKAEFLTPEQRDGFDIDVRATSLIFNKGHRLRVAISSSNYPRFEANRNNGKSWPNDQNYPAAVAHQTIFLGGTEGSAIVLPEVIGAAGP